MRRKKAIFMLAVAAVCGLVGGRAFAQVIDNNEVLYVPAGETYTLDGVHSYNEYVDIEGTLYVTAYNGSGTTGTLALDAPVMSIGGIIDGDGRGFRSDEGPGVGVAGGGGSGAGYGGNGGHGVGGAGGPAYGTTGGPDIEKGSGGNGTGGAGGAGGACIKLEASSLSISGTVTANGNAGINHDWAGGGGSGGGIYIYCADVSVSGTLSAGGGNGGNGTWGGGGGAGGRIKIFHGLLDTTGSTIVLGGGGGGSGSWPTGAGQSGTYHTEAVVFDNEDILYVPAGETYTLDGSHNYNLLVDISGTLYVTAYNGSGTTGTVELEAPQITISGSIDADGRGFRNDEGPGVGERAGGGSGAGYGGSGGRGGGGGGYGGPPYGTETGFDIEKGSGGNNASSSGGAGGGCVLLDGDLISISGTVTANGNPGTNHPDWAAGGGSGGGILIRGDTVNVSGTLSAAGGAGGNANYYGGGGGAGGRIKIFHGCLDSTAGTIVLNGGAGGSAPGFFPGQPGQSGTYHTESDHPAPWRGHESTYGRWEFDTDDLNPVADELENPYGDPELTVYPVDPCWLPTWGDREGIWPLSGSITVRIPDRPNSGPQSMKLIWIQVVWAPTYAAMLDEDPNVTETGSYVPQPAARYPDCVLEEFVEEDTPRNWIHSTYVIVLRPNPASEEITIEGAISVDRIIIETICIPGLRTADLNGDGKIDWLDFAIFASRWLEGTGP